MKRLFLSLLCVSILCAGQAFARSYPTHQISGKLTGVPGNTITVSFASYTGGFKECIDTIKLDGGKFGFDISFPSITPIYIEPLATSDMSEKEQRRQQIFLVAVPGEEAIINGTLDDYTITGSAFYKDFNNMLQAMKPYTSLYSKEKDIESLRETISNAALQYIKSHPDQEAAAILIASINPKNRMQAVNFLSDKAKTERIVTFYQPLVPSNGIGE